MKKKLLKECLGIAIDHNNPDDHTDFHCFKHYTFIIQLNKIISFGMNRAGSPMIPIYKPFSKIHAEVEAVRKVRHFLDTREPFEALNIRLSQDNQLRESKPCSSCFSLLNALGCSRVYFSTSDGKFDVINF